MPPQATKDWLALLEEKARNRGIYVDTDIDGRIFHFHLGNDPGVIGKVRYSEAKSRNYESEQGQKHIWHRYNREKELIQQGSERDVVNVTLDVWDKNEFNPEQHHFIFLTEQMIAEETYSKGDQKIWIVSDGRYEGALAKYVDDWDAIFEYATGTDSPEQTTDQESGQATEGSRPGRSIGTSGTLTEGQRKPVRVSDEFGERVYDRFDRQCPLSGIDHPDLLTVSHVLVPEEDRELAQNIENVVLLDWTHHMAFGANLWTFDESGRIWVAPEFEAGDSTLQTSLVEQHGEKVEAFAKVADEYVERRNDDLGWWPPR